MPMSPAFLANRFAQFMVSAGPTGVEDPPLGWPDGVSPSPSSFSFVTQVAPGTTNKRIIRTTNVSLPRPQADYVGGYASAPPYWDGVRITSQASGFLLVAVDAANPAGPQTVTVVATDDKQDVFTLPGSPAIALVQKIRRVSDNFLITFDASTSTLSAGIVGVNEPVVPGRILTGDVIEFTYLLPSSTSPPLGTPVTIIPRKDPTPAPLPIGTAWAGAYRAFVEQGMAGGVPPAPGTLAAAEAAMKAVLDGMMATAPMALTALQSGVLAFWASVAASAPVVFPTALSVVPPPSATGMAAAVAATAAANMALVPSDPWTPAAAQAAAANLAAAIFSTSQGALVIFPGPAAVPFV